jgi:hypothetical protein
MTAPEPMTPERLAAFEALCNGATPPPWEWWRDPGLAEDGVHCPEHPLAKRDAAGVLTDTTTVCRGMTGAAREANAQFIAAARTEGPAMAAALRAAWAERDALKADTKRLDLLAETGASVIAVRFSDNGDIVRWELRDDDGEVRGEGETARAAIDAAMAQERADCPGCGGAGYADLGSEDYPRSVKCTMCGGSGLAQERAP